MASEDPVGEVARRFAENLRIAIGEQSVRAVAQKSEVAHVTILAILDGRVWPDMFTISKLERGLDVDLWPGRISQ